MSQRPDKRPPSLASRSPTSEVDQGLDLFEAAPGGGAPPDLYEEKYWYAVTGEASPRGPVSLAAIRKQVVSGSLAQTDLIWHEGMEQWTRVADHAELSSLVSANSRSNTNQHPASPSLSPAPPSAGVDNLLERLGHWTPATHVLRLTARAILAVGLLTLLVSLPALFFGVSWFSNGFLLLLIGCVIELTATVRDGQQQAPAIPVPGSKDKESHQEASPEEEEIGLT